MSKSGAPSAASASASASSDPHSLPPNIKGLIQRYLAVSLPTITLSPELIAVLNKADIVIPTRVQVTMRWWNEDPSNALSVYPKLNSPLSEPIARHQEGLRQRRQEQLLQEVKTRQEQIKDKATSPLSPSQTRSTVASLLMRPWSGKKLLTALRPGKGKSKAQDGQGQGQGQAQGHKDKRPKIDKAPSMPIATSATKILHTRELEADIKPLPSLPEAAYPNTVAYPVRCSLDQLHRYFLEMSSLTLEIQIVNGLSATATVPNMASLLHNIHGTFSGVFPTIILKNMLDLPAEQLFSQQAVIGVVVFQSWLQDTSDVGDSSEGSESTGSIVIEPPIGVHRYHEHQKLPRHHESQGQHYPYGPPHAQQDYRPYHPQHGQPQYPRPHHDQRPRVSVDYTRPAQHPIQGHHQRVVSSSPAPITPIQHPSQRVDAWGTPGGDRFRPRTSLRFGEAPHHSGHPQREFSNAQDHRERRSGYSKNDPSQPSRYSHTRQRSHNEPSTDGAWGRTTSEDSSNRRHARRSSHGKQPAMDSDGPKGQRRPNIKIPVPDVDTQYTRARPYSNRYSIPMSSMDESIPYEDRRRSHDTNMTNIYSQGSRSRPRSGATAAAIGRLDSVLARGEDLLLGMRTSFALDPEEVHRARSNHLRSADSDLLPMSKAIPYWPSKSRFYLELSIPAAYLTSHGLLKGSSKHSSRRGKEKRREDPPPALSPVSPPQRHVQDMSGSSQHFSRRPQREDVQDRYESKPSSPPRQLRRSRGPIQFESISPRAAGSQVQRDPSTSTSAAYQSFMPEGLSSGFVLDRNRAGGVTGASDHKESSQGQPHHQPRKSKSYPPQSAPSSQRNSRRRRLSSHDRLQIRMNPKAGDILNYVPDLFPSRSMSALVIPEYKGTSSSSSATTTDAEDGTNRQKQGRYQHQRQGTSYSNPPFGTTSGTPYRSMRESNPLRKNHTKKHRQEFNFQTRCQFHLTPETMAACMIENISVEVWKLNSKRQTMIELGTAKLPLHKVLSQIMHKTAAYPTDVHSQGQRYHPGARQDSRYSGRGGFGSRPGPEFGPRAFGHGHPSAQKPVWRLEPNVYDIRSRHGTIIGQLDADIWVHPRSRSSSMVSAAA